MLPLLLALGVAQGPTLDLSLMPSGVFDRVQGYAPNAVSLARAKPAKLKKAPPAARPRYGTITVGAQAFLVMLDGTDNLVVDSDDDGDLTDDAPATWDLKTYRSAGMDKTIREGFATLDVVRDGKTVPCRIGLYETDQADTIGYYTDFALAGRITLGGKAYEAIYADPSGNWDGKRGVLMIDKDGDGKFNPNYEFYRGGEPFNVGGTTYELGDLGGKLVAQTSARRVAERTRITAEAGVHRDPNEANGLKAGSPALAFAAATMAGEKVSFPSSYAGKVVLVDFWATWCDPCLREVPNVVRAYGAYHGKGFDVLGVSLDREKAETQIKAVTAKQGMVWPQIYDGRFFDAAVAKRYKIQAIPAAYLVDGDTGRILASGDDLRGERLGPAVERALAAKSAR